MKKNYNQPIVETTEFIAGGQALCGSPNLSFDQTPITSEEGSGD